MTIGQRIKQRREELKIRQDQLGHLTGMSQAQISRYEKDDNEPGVGALLALSKVLNVSVHWLLGIEEDKQVDLTLQENEVLRLFREKSPERKHILLEIMKWA